MKGIILSVVIALILIGGAYLFMKSSDTSLPLEENNVSIVDGTQIVLIRAKGGYQPRKSIAQSGIPTVLRFNTSGTYDCSASMRIPSLKISKILPQSGSTDIDIGTPQVALLWGSCGMGMYSFEIEFRS